MNHDHGRNHEAVAGVVDPRMVVFVAVGAIVHRILLEHADPTGAWLEGVIDLVLDGVRTDT
ncbi:MAG TPA: hypothetical protein VET27_22665 [Mycobacterium sp.]|nr:hypothetical protein [Mycobacterium sp.]